jgi:hypothetical protein
MSAAKEIMIVEDREEHSPNASTEAGSNGSGHAMGTPVAGTDGPPAVRRRLPDERHSLTHHFSVGGQEGYVTVGLYEDGLPGELFIRMAKEGSTVSGLASLVRIVLGTCEGAAPENDAKASSSCACPAKNRRSCHAEKISNSVCR